jgi:hypothetical protein
MYWCLYSNYIGLVVLISVQEYTAYIWLRHTLIRFVWVSAKFVTCTVVSVNETLVKCKMCSFTPASPHFTFNKCPIYTHDGASANFSTNSYEADYSAYCNGIV